MIEPAIVVIIIFLLTLAGIFIFKSFFKLQGKKLLLISVILFVTTVSAVFFITLSIINSRNFQFFENPINSVKTDKKIIALTFDDGPSAEYTETILSILSQENIKATFFLTGKEIEENYGSAKRIAEEGHELGNHSYSHQRFIGKSGEFIIEEIENTDTLIKAAGYFGNINFRSPYSKKFIILPYLLKKIGKKNILWSIEPESEKAIKNNPEALADYTIANAKPGSIILLHVMYPAGEASRKALPLIISSLKNNSYSFVTVSELIIQGR